MIFLALSVFRKGRKALRSLRFSKKKTKSLRALRLKLFWGSFELALICQSPKPTFLKFVICFKPLHYSQQQHAFL
jgi:hypothetical protein